MDKRAVIRKTGKVLAVAAGLFLFILALYFVKAGAGGIKAWMVANHIGGIPGGVGFGWFMAYICLSGSPVAATSLGLHADHHLNRATGLDSYETFSMIIGSRLGASMVVLLIGFCYDLRGKKEQRSVYVGAVALLTTLTTYLPALLIGLGILGSGALDWVRFNRPDFVGEGLDAVFKPIVEFFRGYLPAWGIFGLGVGVFMSAFRIFDLALPAVDPTHGRIARMSTVVYRPSITFLLGMLVTCVTLSVSVSISLLVPLTARGYVRRENLIPYILGANITTFIDTLFLSLLVNSPDAFTIVFSALASVSIVTMPIIAFFYGRYERMIDSLAVKATLSRRRLAVFVVILFAMPGFLLLFGLLR